MELVLIFGIGILLGITLKTMATNSLTIGYEDYTVVAVDNRIDLNQVEKSVLARNESPFASNTGKGGYCSQE